MNELESNNSIVIYQTSDGETSIDVKFKDETVWLSQAQMAELFQKDRTVISRHINNIFKEGLWLRSGFYATMIAESHTEEKDTIV